MARRVITGDVEIERTLTKLADVAADRVAKNALRAGLTVIAKAMRAGAPVGRTGAVKASIGKRAERNKRSGRFSAKAGVNVGKQRKTGLSAGRIVKAPHSHLVALGTKPRFRKAIGGKFSYITNPTQDQLSTGTMPANPFVRVAYEAAKSAAGAAMHKNAKKSLAREVMKAKSKKTR